MKIGVLSDTHFCSGSRQCCLPPKLLEAFKGADMILHAGDIGDLSCIDGLKKMCPDVRAVWGNMDGPDIRKKLPEKMIINTGKHTIGLTHGYGNPANLIDYVSAVFKDTKVDVIVFGHSHNALNETQKGILFFNPGSPTDKVFAPYNSCGILEINGSIRAEVVHL